MIKIDELDQRIITILEEDSRIPYRHLGQKLGIEESTARKRVLRLREKGVIERFTVEINNASLGRTITAFITVYPSLKHANRVIKELLNLDGVLESYNLSGRCGIFLKAMFVDINALNSFVAEIRSIGGITGIHTCISLETLKRPK